MFDVREDLSTENILSKITEEDIFNFYCTPFKEIGRKFNSELRDDPNPSAIISRYGNKLWYKDFGESIKAVNCFDYVARKYSLTFMAALGKINTDFNLGLKNYIKPLTDLSYPLPNDCFIKKSSSNILYEKKIKLIKPVYRNWLEIDLKYWKNKYYIDIKRLERFEIRPIKGFYFEDKYIKTDLYTYIFLVDIEEGIEYYKIYSPFNKSFKWLSNCSSNHYMGYNQLPWLGDTLVITKALKDVIVLSIFNIPAIAPQSESQVISEEMYTKLSKRFKKIYIFYDNDRAGIEGANKTIEVFNDITTVFIPLKYKVKDISDFIDEYRYKKTKELIKKLIC